jgi:hypothetical protein
MVPMAGLEPARAVYGPTDFKSVASAISPHRLFSFLKAVLPMRIGLFCSFLLYHDCEDAAKESSINIGDHGAGI